MISRQRHHAINVVVRAGVLASVVVLVLGRVGVPDLVKLVRLRLVQLIGGLGLVLLVGLSLMQVGRLTLVKLVRRLGLVKVGRLVQLVG